MKKVFIIPILVIVIVAVAFKWWSMPIHFLSKVESNDIMRIDVFNGNTGKHFVIEDYENINKITSSIQEIPMKKSKISVAYMGTLFELKFINTEGKQVDKLIVNHYDTIRKDPFIYKGPSNNICLDLLIFIESTIEEDK